MKLALIHDFLTQDGGAEKVLKSFQEIWPKAPTYVLFYDREKINPEFLKTDLRTSFIQKMPGGVTKYQWYLPLMPLATEQHDLQDFDLVLSSSTLFAKGALTNPQTLHICYCHTPTRFLWSNMHQYIEDLNYNRLIKKIIPFALKDLRQWDMVSASRVDKFVANSETVKDRIKKYYRRPSDVIYPPVKTNDFYISKPENYFLAGGRLVGYKRFDIIVKAFNRLGMPLKIFGQGPMFERLRRQAKPNIEFLGNVTDKEKSELFSKCLAFLNPQVEDFGITAIEAMAAGRPVIAYAAGGALETVVPGKTGEFMDEQSWEELGNKIIQFDPEKYKPEVIKRHASQFDEARFKSQIKDYVDLKWREFGERI
ncbi:glycosyltransferase [Patescibacteria group bacterium]|nr:glycosyltransferase [Patescibacteria group bacterium]MBU1922414.1 glycosyltransferase [Patescibacteria group bacterium]